MDGICEMLHHLCDAMIVSGYEKSSDNVVLELLKKYGILHEIDTIGNVIFKKEGSGTLTLMIVAHYDEIGFAVKYIDDDGYIYISPAGGVDLSILPGQRVVIRHDDSFVYGVIGSQPIHIKKQSKSNNKTTDISDLWIDIGVNGVDNIKNMVAVGDSISFAPNFTMLNNGIVTSKSLDDRSGVAVLLSLFIKLKEIKISNYKCIYFVATSQEEMGLRGAQVAGYNINPDICIAMDVSHATDYPTINLKKYGDIRLGNGAIIPLGANFDNKLQTKLKNSAQKNNIPYQLDSIPSNSGTDIATIQLIRGGCQSGLISLPCRYMHTPLEAISIKDMESAIDILKNFILSDFTIDS